MVVARSRSSGKQHEIVKLSRVTSAAPLPVCSADGGVITAGQLLGSKRKASSLPPQQQQQQHIVVRKPVETVTVEDVIDDVNSLSYPAAVLKLSKQFKALDAVIYALQQRSNPGTWDKVKFGIDVMLKDAIGGFNLQDLSLICSIHPGAYKLEWKKVSPDSLSPIDLHLCITINDDKQLSVSSSSNSSSNSSSSSSSTNRSKSLLGESRYQLFQQLLDEKIQSLQSSSNDTVGECIVLAPNDDIIPVKPYTTSSSQHSSSNSNTIARISQLASEIRSETLQANQDEYDAIPAIDSDGVVVDRLRQVAIEREKLILENNKKAVQNRQKELLKSRMYGLLPLADTLRSVSLMNKRRSHPLTSLAADHALSLGIDRYEFEVRIQLLQNVVPEFVAIFPATVRVMVTTVRVNLDCPYGAVRKKIIAALV